MMIFFLLFIQIAFADKMFCDTDQNIFEYLTDVNEDDCSREYGITLTYDSDYTDFVVDPSKVPLGYRTISDLNRESAKDYSLTFSGTASANFKMMFFRFKLRFCK